jgi:hypothetical protein
MAYKKALWNGDLSTVAQIVRRPGIAAGDPYNNMQPCYQRTIRNNVRSQILESNESLSGPRVSRIRIHGNPG